MTNIYLSLLGVALCYTLSAATLSVDDDGAGDYTTITAAIAAASENDIILITGGIDKIHTENAIAVNKTLTIRGQGLVIVQAASTTDIADDGVFLIAAGVKLSIEDLTIQNGVAKTGGASTFQRGGAARITCIAGTTVAFTRVNFKNNQSEDEGGAVFITGADGNILFTECTFLDNKANETSSEGDGGAIYNGGGTLLTIKRCTFNGNTAYDDGGAIFVNTANSVNKFINCTFYNNTAGAGNPSKAQGGALFLGNAISHELTNCTVVNNQCEADEPDDNQGAGIYFSGGANKIVNTIVAYNTGPDNGEDIYTTVAFTQTTSLVEDCDGTVACPVFTSTSDPLLGTYSTCSNGQGYLEPGIGSDALNSATTSGGDIPTIDICGHTRSTMTMEMGSKEVVPTCDESSPIVNTAGINVSAITGTFNNFTYYCTESGDLLLALDPSISGAVIPATAVKVKVKADQAEYYVEGTGFITNPDGAVAMTRRWEVSPTVQPNGSDVIVRFFYTKSDFDAVETQLTMQDGSWGLGGDVTNMNFFKVDNAALGEFPEIVTIPNSDVSIITNGGSASNFTWLAGSHLVGDHFADFTVSSFSGGGGGAGGGGAGNTGFLPVELLSFKAKAMERNILLHWETASEIDNQGFELQKSLDGKNWRPIDFVKGHGTTNEAKSYNSVDQNPVQGNNYYRLMQLDYDGASEYSEVISVNWRNKVEETSLKVYPNPVNDVLTIESSVGTLQLYDQTGKLLQQFQLGNTISVLDANTLMAGLYSIVLIQENGTIQSTTFVKSR